MSGYPNIDYKTSLKISILEFTAYIEVISFTSNSTTTCNPTFPWRPLALIFGGNCQYFWTYFWICEVGILRYGRPTGYWWARFVPVKSQTSHCSLWSVNTFINNIYTVFISLQWTLQYKVQSNWLEEFTFHWGLKAAVNVSQTLYWSFLGKLLLSTFCQWASRGSAGLGSLSTC